MNPAGLADQDERTFLVHHGLLQFDTSWDLAAVAYPIPGLGAAGLGLARIGSSGIEAYDSANQPLGTIGYSETSIAVSVARRVYGPIGAGISFKVLSQSLGAVSAAAPSMDLGAVYRPELLRGGQVGFSVQNVVAGSLDLGLDSTALVQEFIPARGGHIVRVEVVGTKFLYGIKVHLTGETFDLCPADICKTTTGQELQRSACPVDAPKTGLRVEGYTPPNEIIHSVERIMQEATIEVGGVEYIIDDRDGQLYYYDINALSNFVAEGLRVVGFDPFDRLADFLQREAA